MVSRYTSFYILLGRLYRYYRRLCGQKNWQKFEVWGVLGQHSRSIIGCYYYIRIDVNPGGSETAICLMGVRLYWWRQISPSPSTATFNDVGIGHWAFQFVEALAASGITRGCPDGPNLYCPDKPVSRAAMAAFLARALGLHWDTTQGY